MHIYTLHKWQHKHDFTALNPSNEHKTLGVVLLTAGMMVVEIAARALFGSMALLADGWHMSLSRSTSAKMRPVCQKRALFLGNPGRPS